MLNQNGSIVEAVEHRASILVCGASAVRVDAVCMIREEVRVSVQHACVGLVRELVTSVAKHEACLPRSVVSILRQLAS